MLTWSARVSHTRHRCALWPADSGDLVGKCYRSDVFACSGTVVIEALGEEAATAAPHPERLRDAEGALARAFVQQGVPAATVIPLSADRL